MASGHSHKSLTIFLFYLPISRLLEDTVTCSKQRELKLKKHPEIK